jgi:C-terminal processing protease CtpA/Prc
MSQPARRGRIVLLVLAAFAGGLIFAQPLSAGRFNPYQKLGVCTKVLSYIESHYVEDLSETDLMYGAARGLTDVLDPHSRFMDPEEYGRLKKETEGNEEIEGIGIDVEKRKNRFVIISPIEGSPAARAGIEPGDVIKRVDGVEISTLEFDEAVARMQGPGGSEVTLVVERRNRELTFKIRRAKYEVKAVEGRLSDLRSASIRRRSRDPKLLQLEVQLQDLRHNLEEARVHVGPLQKRLRGSHSGTCTHELDGQRIDLVFFPVRPVDIL